MVKLIYGKITKKDYSAIVNYLTELKLLGAVLPSSDGSRPTSSDPQKTYDRLTQLVTELTTGPKENAFQVAEQLVGEVMSIAFNSVGDEGIAAIVEGYTGDAAMSRKARPESIQPKPEQRDASLIPIAKYGRNPQEVAKKVALLFYEIIDSLDVLKSKDKEAERDILGAQISKADVGYFTTLIRAMLDGRDRYQGFILNTRGLIKEGSPPKGL